ncbi:MAG: hypothetical protein KJO07_07010, partial [Deltaproteobacteria bacterium]|nr:hypothetical protein [Deltaproteobacteria bacterium]
PQLADLLIRRIAVDHLYRVEHGQGPSPWRYLRRLRWEAVLPVARTRAMLAMVQERAPSLAASHESF